MIAVNNKLINILYQNINLELAQNILKKQQRLFHWKPWFRFKSPNGINLKLNAKIS